MLSSGSASKNPTLQVGMQGWIYGQLLALKDVDSVHSLLQIRLGGVYTLRLANVHHKRCVVWIGLCSVFTSPLGVPRWQSHRRSGLATLPSVGAVP